MLSTRTRAVSGVVAVIDGPGAVAVSAKGQCGVAMLVSAVNALKL